MTSAITKISYVIVALVGLACLLHGVNLLLKVVNKKLEAYQCNQ